MLKLLPKYSTVAEQLAVLTLITMALTVERSPTAILDADDRLAVADILNELSFSPIDSNGNLDITPVSVLLLEYIYHYLRWDSNGLFRSPSEVSAMILPGSFAQELAEGSPADTPQRIKNVLRYSLSVSSHGKVGLADIIETLQYAVKSTYIPKFLDTLNWTVLTVPDHRIAMHLSLGPIKLDHFGLGIRFNLLEGMMLAVTLYPNISYRAGLDDKPLIAEYDAKVQLSNRSLAHRVEKYRIKVPGVRFTGRYLREIIYQNELVTAINQRQRNKGDGSEKLEEITSLPLQEGYIRFDVPEFLQGLLSFTHTIAVEQPWLSLDIKDAQGWIPATI